MSIARADVDSGLFELVQAFVSMRPLLAAAGPGRVTAPATGQRSREILTLQRVIDLLTRSLGLPGLVVESSADGLVAVELVISEHLARAGLGSLAAVWGDVPERELLNAVANAVADAQAQELRPTLLVAHDGTPLRGYSVGEPSRTAVVIATACGMPVGLVAGWVSKLSAWFPVVTFESRGLFGDDPAFDERGQDLEAQAADVATVIEDFGIERAHLMGLCGGAPIALAAANHPAVSSLSLWHGDYELGEDAPKTRHQRDVEAMLTMAGRSRSQARSLHALFQRPQTLAKLRADIAHHIFYPYATPELLYRYGRLNGAIMTTDCRPLLDIHQPTLVVTSHKDTTAHPQGSIVVADRLAQGRLGLLADGDHLAAFDASDALVELAGTFVAETLGEAQ